MKNFQPEKYTKWTLKDKKNKSAMFYQIKLEKKWRVKYLVVQCFEHVLCGGFDGSDEDARRSFRNKRELRSSKERRLVPTCPELRTAPIL